MQMLLLWLVRATLTHEATESRSRFYQTMKSHLKVAFVAMLIASAAVVGAIVGAKPAQAQTDCYAVVQCATFPCNMLGIRCTGPADTVVAVDIGRSGKSSPGTGLCAQAYILGCSVPATRCGNAYTYAGPC